MKFLTLVLHSPPLWQARALLLLEQRAALVDRRERHAAGDLVVGQRAVGHADRELDPLRSAHPAPALACCPAG